MCLCSILRYFFWTYCSVSSFLLQFTFPPIQYLLKARSFALSMSLTSLPVLELKTRGLVVCSTTSWPVCAHTLLEVTQVRKTKPILRCEARSTPVLVCLKYVFFSFNPNNDRTWSISSSGCSRKRIFICLDPSVFLPLKELSAIWLHCIDDWFSYNHLLSRSLSIIRIRQSMRINTFFESFISWIEIVICTNNNNMHGVVYHNICVKSSFGSSMLLSFMADDWFDRTCAVELIIRRAIGTANTLLTAAESQ